MEFVIIRWYKYNVHVIRFIMEICNYNIKGIIQNIMILLFKNYIISEYEYFIVIYYYSCNINIYQKINVYNNFLYKNV